MADKIKRKRNPKKNPREFDMESFIEQRKKEETLNHKPEVLTAITDTSGGEFVFHPYGESKDFKAFYSEAMIFSIGKQALEHVRDTDRCLTMLSFLNKKLLPSDVWYQWCKKYEYIHEINKMCLQILAERRETGMHFRELDRESILRSSHMYNKTWHDINKYWSDLRKNEQGEQQGTVIVQMMPIENTDVPMSRSRTMEEIQKDIDEKQNDQDQIQSTYTETYNQ